MTSSLSVEASYGKYIYNYSYLIHDDFQTDPERYISPFYSVKNLNRQYSETYSLVSQCRKQSGFMKKPPAELREETLNSITELQKNILCVTASYHITNYSYYLSERIKNHVKDIDNMIQRGEHSKALKNIYDLIYAANLVQPVLRLISHY